MNSQVVLLFCYRLLLVLSSQIKPRSILFCRILVIYWSPHIANVTKLVSWAVCGVGGAGILVACFLFFVRHKRKRRKQGRASCDLMRSGSSLQSYSKDLELGGSLHIFTYEELEEATEGFSDTRELGDGGFGTVYKGEKRQNSQSRPSTLAKISTSSLNFQKVHWSLNYVL
jgi:hypothetical protein